ncbi:MAG: NAD(+)/NADH kinase, partial [Acidobacteriota bacterium]|nr:NAD(+)/NADH kinase [Acidobacteriota bacterium]
MTDPAIRRVGVALKTTSPDAVELGRQLVAELDRLGIEAVIDRETAEVLESKTDIEREHLASVVDLIVVIGGDGTLLSVTRGVLGGTPILGINMGTLGFLTEHPADRLLPVLHAALEGRVEIVRRERLTVTVENPNKEKITRCVLNDAVIN